MAALRSRQSLGRLHQRQADAWTKLVHVEPFEQQAISEIQRDYSNSRHDRGVTRHGYLYGLVRSFLEVRTGDRVLNRVRNGVSAERFQKILERENCTLDDVSFSENKDAAFINFVFREDDGHCLAILTDLQSNNTYVRCCFVARFVEDLEPSRINHLNMMSKFLKFYRVEDGRLFVEYSVLTIDLLDSSIAATIDMFHGSVNFILRNRFTYAALPSAPAGGDDRVPDAYGTQATAQKLADISRSDLNGIESRLDRIVDRLGGGLFSARPLDQMVNQLSEVTSLLKEISGKLDKR